MLCAVFILCLLIERCNIVTCAVRTMKPCVNFGIVWSLDVYLDHAQISMVPNTLGTHSSYSEGPRF